MYKLIFSFLIAVILPSAAFSNIDLSGSIRNDAALVQTTNALRFNDIVENKLVFSKKAEDWRFYSDLRLYLLYGDAANQPLVLNVPGLPEPIVTNVDIPVNVRLMRMFVRWSNPLGNLTVGKTYVNFGNAGMFNPFELDKSVSFSDLSYDKEGIFALLQEFSFSDLSGAKCYVNPSADLTNTAVGGSVYMNAFKFDIGAAANRKGINTNSAGVYFKGDLELGVNGSYNYHFTDRLSDTNRFSELTLGADYSFLEGKLYTGLTYYYDERGSGKTNDYHFDSADDKYFVARNYLYAEAYFTPDDFLKFQLNTFINLSDYSALIIPGATYTVSDGLDLTGQFVYVSGQGEQEYSISRLGKYTILLRLEGKL